MSGQVNSGVQRRVVMLPIQEILSILGLNALRPAPVDGDRLTPLGPVPSERPGLIHPKHLEALEKQEREAAERAEILVTGEEAEASVHGLSYVDVKPRHSDRLHPHPGMTVAYRAALHNVFEVATSLRNPADRYDKELGRAYAAINFAEGRTIRIRVPNHAVKNVGRFFGEMLSGDFY